MGPAGNSGLNLSAFSGVPSRTRTTRVNEEDMKTRGWVLWILMLGTSVFGCDDDSGDDGVAGTEDGGSNGGDGDSSASGGSGSCEQVSPQGQACSEGDDCSVACLCSGSVVNSGRCVNGSCANPVDACEDACADFDAGDFSGAYCALDNSGGDDGGDSGNSDSTDSGEDSGGDGGGVCVPTGDVCEINGDCCGFASGTSLCTSFSDGFVGCADVCFFDSDCVSDCCVPLDSGLSVCAASSECG